MKAWLTKTDEWPRWATLAFGILLLDNAVGLLVGWLA